MKSEKVKEIKEYLEEEVFIATEFEDKLRRIPTRDLQKILTLINELESENERLKKDNELLRNAKVVYETVDYCYEDLKKAEKRIAELEKKNERLLDSVETVQNNRCVYKCELTKKQLRQFAEMLKERYVDENLLIDGYFRVIDELLKEYEVEE